MKKVIVFGGSGFLGSYVADELTARNYDVVIADINESLYLRPEQSFVHCDILDQNAVMEAIRGAPIVYNFAGLADLNDSISRPHETLEQNVMGNINILEACRKNETERFVYASIFTVLPCFFLPAKIFFLQSFSVAIATFCTYLEVSLKS